MLKPYKFIVKAVPQIIGDDGEPVGEEFAVEPVELIGVKQLVAWANEFPARLAEAEAQRLAATPDAIAVAGNGNRAQRRAKPRAKTPRKPRTR